MLTAASALIRKVSSSIMFKIFKVEMTLKVAMLGDFIGVYILHRRCSQKI